MSQQHFSPELNAKVKKNLLRFFMFTVTMIFAGLTSAYIVSMGQIFWVSIDLPNAFNLSTTCILASSIFLIVAVRAVKKNQAQVLKIATGIALILGVLFGYFQLRGWQQLYQTGSPSVGPIVNHLGQYGKYYTFTYQQKEITYDNNHFYWRGEELADGIHDQMKALSEQLFTGAKEGKNNFKLTGYGTDFMLHYLGMPVTYVNNKLYIDTMEMDLTRQYNLRYFSESIVLGHGDFVVKGEYGVDFVIYYLGDPLEYKNRTFYRKGKLLTAAQLDKLNTQDNTSSSYLYAFTGVHLAHWLGGVIALLVVFIKSLNSRYSQANYLGLTLGATYWHFLGIIWLYLYFFLIFIH